MLRIELRLPVHVLRLLKQKKSESKTITSKLPVAKEVQVERKTLLWDAVIECNRCSTTTLSKFRNPLKSSQMSLQTLRAPVLPREPNLGRT